jgi:hypothetical protein
MQQKAGMKKTTWSHKNVAAFKHRGTSLTSEISLKNREFVTQQQFGE